MNYHVHFKKRTIPLANYMHKRIPGLKFCSFSIYNKSLHFW